MVIVLSEQNELLLAFRGLAQKQSAISITPLKVEVKGKKFPQISSTVSDHRSARTPKATILQFHNINYI
jgi:hypothetical protein